MTRPEQARYERACLDFALEKLGIEPTRIEGRERPDFLLEINGRTVAVEVTEARDQEAASARGTIRRLKSGLKEALTKANYKVTVAVSLNEGAAVLLEKYADRLKGHVQSLARMAGTFVENGWTRREYGPAHLKRLGVNWIKGVTIWKSEEPASYWAVHGSGQRRRVIQEAIDAKAGKLAVYREAAPEVWLLVVAGTGGFGASIDRHEAEGRFTSPFDRTIFVEGYEGACIELETQPPPD